jgi:hypothetical protein
VECDRPAARRTHRHDRRLAGLREALSLCVEMQAAKPGKWWWPAARHYAGCRCFGRDDPAKMCIGTRGVPYIIRGRARWTSARAYGARLQESIRRDVGSARQVGAVDRVAAPVTNLDASLASHATSSASSCDVPSRPMIGCSAAIAVSAASSRFASSRGVRMNPGPDRVHADVVAACSSGHRWSEPGSGRLLRSNEVDRHGRRLHQ